MRFAEAKRKIRGKMISVDIESFFASLIACAVGVYLAYEIYWMRMENRSRRDDNRKQTLYCCVRCGKVYAKPRERDEEKTAPCPDCAFENIRLRF